MSRFRIVINVLGMVLLLSGCATISNQTKQKVNISTQNGDSVIIDIGGQKANVPGEVRIARKGAVIKVLSEDNPCYEDSKLVIAGEDEISGWFWGNILTGGTLGSLTDYVVGGMWVYSNPNFIVPIKRKAHCK